LKRLLTYDSGFVTEKTAGNFGLAMPATNGPQWVTFPPGTRAGFLTDPAWLAAHSEPHRNNPISRGKFIRVELLCGQVPPIPITADIKPIPDEPTRSMRELLAEHRIEPSCAGCHDLMDPLGLPFEMYDHVGRLRDQELGKPVNASGALKGSGDQDGDVSSAIELAQRLSQSSTVEQCFTMQAYEYFVGRPPTQADACALSSAHAAFTSSEDLVALLAAIYSPENYATRQGASQ